VVFSGKRYAADLKIASQRKYSIDLTYKFLPSFLGLLFAVCEGMFDIIDTHRLFGMSEVNFDVSILLVSILLRFVTKVTTSGTHASLPFSATVVLRWHMQLSRTGRRASV